MGPTAGPAGCRWENHGELARELQLGLPGRVQGQALQLACSAGMQERAAQQGWGWAAQKGEQERAAQKGWEQAGNSPALGRCGSYACTACHCYRCSAAVTYPWRTGWLDRVEQHCIALAGLHCQHLRWAGGRVWCCGCCLGWRGGEASSGATCMVRLAKPECRCQGVNLATRTSVQRRPCLRPEHARKQSIERALRAQYENSGPLSPPGCNTTHQGRQAGLGFQQGCSTSSASAAGKAGGPS